MYYTLDDMPDFEKDIITNVFVTADELRFIMDNIDHLSIPVWHLMKYRGSSITSSSITSSGNRNIYVLDEEVMKLEVFNTRYYIQHLDDFMGFL